MQMTRIQKLRRQEYAEAASRTFVEHGVGETTFALVAKTAGVPKSNVLHYFADKTDLIESAFRHRALVFAKEATELMKRANSPWDRIYAVVEANFSPTNFQPENIRSWMFMCAETQTNENLGRLQRAMNKRVYRNLVFALSQVTEREKAQQSALAIGLMMQGLWLRRGTEPGRLERQGALDQIEFLLSSLFPSDAERLRSRERMAEIQRILLG